MKIAIAGLGTVGAGLVKLLQDNADEVLECAAQPIEVVAISSRSKGKARDVDISKIQWVDAPLDLIKTEADVIVELIGGQDGIALELVKAALKAKKHVVTANKAMLAYHGGELAKLAEDNGVELRYEAAVAGGIPVIKVLREGLAGSKITRISGILNGTCNFILTEMENKREGYESVLKEAQEKGYAEADPSFDVGGIDAAHKLALLAANAYGKLPNLGALYIEGIENIKLADIDFAKKLGYRIKHICITAEHGKVIEQRAHPCLLPNSHALANVNNVFNAVEIEGVPVGKLVLTGRGAGSGPTASAVAADVIDIALGHKISVFTVPVNKLEKLDALDMEKISSAYYVRLSVQDKPGVLEEITSIFKDNNISIHKFLQDDVEEGIAQILAITHVVTEAEFNKAVKELAKLKNLTEKPQIIRVLG